MTIPETLISNDKNSIIDFISKNETGTVYKTFVPATWKENKNLFSFYTTEVISNDLPDQEVVKLTPGIYQKKLTKLYEIRAVFFENYYVAVKIHNSEELDWRQQSTPHKMSPLKLPYLIERQCLALMKSLGIIFGSFDFVVTPDGDHIFLEVNEMGQFLWIEDVLPELKLLDIFCEFIISKSQSEKTSFLNSVNNFEKRTIA
jgi:glutathione synthase/RimK-type ligase-like ATP-grasp enzyme